MRFLRILVAALVAWLGFASSVAAVPLPDSSMAIYTYDASWHVAPLLSAATERGPPADEDTDTTPDAVDGRSHGASTRRQARELLTSTTYDASRSLVQVDSGTATTQGRAEAGDNRDLRPLWGAMVAAKSLSALEQGAAKVPGEWGPGLANRDLGGTRWFDPAAPKANGIRIDEGVPHSSFPSQQVDHVIVRSGGRILGPDGKPIVGSLKQNPDAHIPLSDWLNWTSWDAP